MNGKKIPHFIDPAEVPKIVQMEGLQTIILTRLHGEKMMMVLNITSPGKTVPLHSHPHEQIGMVYSDKGQIEDWR